jgi:cation diffusion facilitator family transporter
MHNHSHHHDHHDHHDHDHSHAHTHGLVSADIIRSKEGIHAVSISLIVLLVTAIFQIIIFFATNSVSLLADMIHNLGDAMTAIPLAVAFWMRNRETERYAGYFVVATIFVSACVTVFEAVQRLFIPEEVTHIPALFLAGIIGFLGNEIAAVIRIRAGKHIHSSALIADGNHARIDGIVSLSVVASAVLVFFGLQIADPIIGLLITFVLIRIAWHSFETIRND